MAWDGYFVFAGSEIINAQRVEAYMADAKQPWFYPQYETTAIGILADETYVDPWTDRAPWTDPDNPDTYRFWGVYPLNVAGLEDDTGEAVVTQNLGDGGWISQQRKTPKTGVFEVMLMGAEECSVEAGFRWLKSALGPAPCTDEEMNGSELCYYACEPCLGEECTASEAQECAAAHFRTVRNCKVTNAPKITAKRKTSNGAHIWVVQFTITAGVPFEFGTETLLVRNFMRADNPWAPSVVPADWAFSVTPSVEVDDTCAVPAYEPIIDPLCPAVLVPPGPPSVALGCYTPPEAWSRRWFTLPRKYVPYWGDVVPVVRVRAFADVRNLRLRFYADVNGDASVLDDPCSYCGDILFSYVPVDHVLILDGVTQTVYAEGPGGTLRRADSLIFKTDGTPFEWPILTCGYGYVVAVDLPDTHTGPLPGVDLSLTPRAA